MRKYLLLLTLFLAPIPVVAYDALIDGIYYNIISKAKIAEVTCGSGSTIGSYYSGDVIIPNEIVLEGETYNVTSIDERAFYNSKNLSSITIPNSVVSIGSGAFGVCSGLSSITIPNSVTSIGDGIFQFCSTLAYIKLSDSIKSIGRFAFEDCTNLTSITIPDIVTSIGDYAFQNCI